jgi:hypothetical protein
MGVILKERWSDGSLNCLPFNGDHDNRDFLQGIDDGLVID